MRLRLLAAVSLAALAVPALAPAHAQTAAAPARSAQSAALAKLFADSDEGSLKRNPIQGLFRGDMRYASQFGDYITDAYLAAEKKAAEDELARLNAIDRSKLSADEQVSYDVFKWQRTMDVRGYDPAILAATVVRPIDHFTGFHVFMPDISSGQGAAPFKTVADYENNLKRLDGFVTLIDRSIGRMKQGLASGVVQPKLVMNNVVGQLDGLIAQGVEGSTYYGPVKKFPDGISAADRARLTAEYRVFIAGKLIPAHKRLRDFIVNDYMPKARDKTGLSAMPGGDNLYRYLVETQTTTTMTPDEIHNLGLSEVARIRAGMEKVRTQVGFKGTLPEFFTFLRTDKQFQPASREALRDGYFAIGRKVDARIGELFRTLPKSKLDIRPVPEFKEKTDAAGSYQQGTPDGSRPGVFYYNAYDLPSRATWGMETLYLHEGAPGHHFQISLAQENEALPPFQRFGGNTAYVEGWALYAESLGPEIGMFTDPYQMYGHLGDEMLRAMRLVVDTGLHSKGWTRDQAIQYMLDNSAISRTDATAEVERYIAMPGQALAYKVGQLTIRRLRTKAEAELGAKFDVRAFHEQVLMTGALPMAVLEAKIDRWIAAEKAK
jgi:uncharacterized protein (DUF885 family)